MLKFNNVCEYENMLTNIQQWRTIVQRNQDGSIMVDMYGNTVQTNVCIYPFKYDNTICEMLNMSVEDIQYAIKLVGGVILSEKPNSSFDRLNRVAYGDEGELFVDTVGLAYCIAYSSTSAIGRSMLCQWLGFDYDMLDMIVKTKEEEYQHECVVNNYIAQETAFNREAMKHGCTHDDIKNINSNMFIQSTNEINNLAYLKRKYEIPKDEPIMVHTTDDYLTKASYIYNTSRESIANNNINGYVDINDEVSNVAKRNKMLGTDATDGDHYNGLDPNKYINDPIIIEPEGGFEMITIGDATTFVEIDN